MLLVDERVCMCVCVCFPLAQLAKHGICKAKVRVQSLTGASPLKQCMHSLEHESPWMQPQPVSVVSEY